MFDTDHEMYLEFAQAYNVDFDWLAKLIDGQAHAGGGQAGYLASVTATRAELWLAGGDPKRRLIAIKLWWLKRGRLATVDVSDLWFSDEQPE